MSLYLIQPCELKKSKNFKLGMSSKSDLTRVRSYHKGTRYLAIFECENALEVERILIQEFKKKYTLIAGNEFFEIIDENEALELFIQIFLKYRKPVEIIHDEKSYVSNIIDDLTVKFKNITLDWKKFSFNPDK